MGKETKNLMLEVSAGMLVFTAAAMAAAFVVYPKGSVFAGLLLGLGLALVMFLSMALVLENSMSTEDPQVIQKRTIIGSVVRYLLLIVTLVVIILRYSDYINPVATVIGVLGLKAGAFLQPVMHKIAGTWKKKE